jgi:hypothetical protein
MAGSLGGGVEVDAATARVAVTALLASDSGLGPMVPFAVTVNVYVVPFASPLKIAEVVEPVVNMVATTVEPE